MVTVEYNGKIYAYINKHDCWVDNTNKKIKTAEIAQNLKQIALSTGYQESDFVKPVAELQKYLNKNTEIQESSSKKEEKPIIKKSPTAISLMDFIKKQKGE